MPIFDRLRELRVAHDITPPPPLGDPRCRTVVGLQQLFRGWALKIEDLELAVPVPAGQLPGFLRVAFYGVDGLGDTALAELDRWLLGEFGDLDWPFALRLGLATAPPRRGGVGP